MSKFDLDKPVSEDLYKIGVVAKRTGITPECLRAWERRYGLAPAQRAGKTRFYSAAQLDRFTTIKALLDQGHPISQVIHLKDAELQRRLRPRLERAPARRARRVGIVGSKLVHAFREAPQANLGVVAQWATLADLLADQGALPALDGVALHLPSLDLQPIENISEIFPDARVVAVFAYATAKDLADCRAAGHAMLRWPADWAAVERLLGAGTLLPSDGDTACMFSDEELLHVSLMASRAACECPAHLAKLIGDLNDYAVHADRCDGEEDHRVVASDVHAARARLERSLHALVMKHGLLAAAN